MSRHEIEREYGIRKSIKDWESQKDKIINSVKKNSFRLEGGGRKTCTKDIEQEILIWIHTCRRHGSAITSNQIIVYAIKIIGYDFKNTFNAYVCWVKLFLRHNLTIRKCTHSAKNRWRL